MNETTSTEDITMQLSRAITIKFVPATDNRAARFRVYSSLHPKGRTVAYPPAGSRVNQDSPKEMALFAARSELQLLNAGANTTGFSWTIIAVAPAWPGDNYVVILE